MSYRSTQGNFLRFSVSVSPCLRFSVSPSPPAPGLGSGLWDLASASRAWIQSFGPGSHPQALVPAHGLRLQPLGPSLSPWALALAPGPRLKGGWGGGEAEKIAMWIHRTSPPGPMPHLLYSQQQDGAMGTDDHITLERLFL